VQRQPRASLPGREGGRLSSQETSFWGLPTPRAPPSMFPPPSSSRLCPTGWVLT
jgi:hypothetical protein